MSPITFESMAVEVLQQICRDLDYESLFDFALVSKACNAIANLYLFRKIRITVLSPKQLQLDVHHWSRMLEHASSLNHVRRVEIDGNMLSKENDTGQLRDIESERLKRTKRDDDADHDLSVWAEEEDPWYHEWEDKTPPEQILLEDDAWKPLADFVRLLPALSDLVYSCTGQITPCLLDVLHQHHPECRLHMRTLHFNSLNRQDIDPYEFAVASSPCLYRISTRYTEWSSDGEGDYHKEATLRIVSGLAPNIKDVRTSWISPAANSPALLHAWGRVTKKEWPGFSLDTRKTDIVPAKLERLELEDTNNHVLLKTWGKYTNFSILRILKLRFKAPNEGLSWAAANCSFDSLTTLSLQVPASVWTKQEWHELDLLLDTFLRNLPPLQNIQIIGCFGQRSLDCIVQHHGKSLRSLWLETHQYNRFVFNVEEVSKIQQNCPMIEELILAPIPRSKGDAKETAIYKSLSAMPKLQRLTLTLDSSNAVVLEDIEFIHQFNGDEDYEVPNDPSFDEFHQQLVDDNVEFYRPRNGHIRDNLINSALDETLARAIFNFISNHKAHNAFALEYLRLHSSGCGWFSGLSDMNTRDLWKAIAISLGREWLLTRSPRDDSRDKVIAKEFGKHLREEDEDQRLHRVDIAAWLKIEPVFRRIWPEKEDENGDWRKDWYSWSLSDS